MAILYPPLLEGTIPATYGDILKIPYKMNQAVSWDNIGGFSVKIKSTNLDNKVMGVLETDKPQNVIDIITVSGLKTQCELTIGNYYKVQVAYKDSDGISPYSTVAIFKYTAKPTIKIQGLDKTVGNSIMPFQSFIGEYKNSQDTSEKVYQYKFDLFFGENLLLTSGFLLHDNQNNKSNGEAIDKWSQQSFLYDEGDTPQVFKIQYSIITINGLELSSPKYQIIQNKQNNNEIDFTFSIKQDLENGTNIIEIAFQEETQYDCCTIITKNKDNQYYTKLAELNLSQNLKIFDFCVSQNIEKFYGFYLSKDEITSKIYPKEKISTTLDFEHCYLFDGERQLKIKYNPKISSIKDTILETKTNTIGSRYPFFFRNGDVKFKEFTISGLLSYLSDEEGLFDKKYSNLNASIDLSADNIKLEREFKLEVLDFLNSGKPMLFRSPTEGNYIVRLSNVSLSPNDTLGRMIHSFSATATECAECNAENLINLGLAIKEVSE